MQLLVVLTCVDNLAQGVSSCFLPLDEAKIDSTQQGEITEVKMLF